MSSYEEYCYEISKKYRPKNYDRQIADLKKWAEDNGIPWEQVKPVPLGIRMQQQHEQMMKGLADEPDEDDEHDDTPMFGVYEYPADYKPPTTEDIAKILMEQCGMSREEALEEAKSWDE